MFDEVLPIDVEVFHFLRPQWLWTIVPALVFFIWGILSIKSGVKWKKVIAPHLRAYVIQKGTERMKILMHSLLFLGFCLGSLAMAGPTWKKVEVPGQELETPLVICLDLSQSMMAEDMQPNRLERAKFKINDFLDQNPQARVSLLAFSGTAHTVVPLTRDYDIIRSHLEGLSPSIMPVQGSDLGAALALADSIIKVTSAPGTILIMSDDFEDQEFDEIQRLASTSGNLLEILVYNTPMGAAVPSPSGRGNLKVNGKEVVSVMNRQIVQKFNSLEKVTVTPLTLDDSDVEAISKKVRANLIFTEKPEEKADQWQDRGLLLIIPMILIFLMWFRKGWVLYALLLITFSSCGKVNSFDDLWFTADYQGQLLSNKGEFEKAAEKYNDPMRKGVAYFKSGKYTEAIQAFAKDTTAEGAYNLGLAYYKNGDLTAAWAAFGLATEMDPNMEQAIANMEAMSKMMSGTSEVDPQEAQEAENGTADNTQENDSMEDLGGGGQEATEEDMKEERLSETVNTDVRKAKELEEVPDDIGAHQQETNNQKVLLQKVDDDPALFMKRKFEYQLKNGKVKPSADEKAY
ncbi:VWA domain-containing protein [Echinicola marina]|uniref:VWA domain-containing protein n=1 Tax=Echinicola marina TaxID=2859768 RepID=UPI001CF667CE|nr:VWA domain-containing protein [Echinicola marina]UCS92071.1 VWA domain-containing protein [Echinicola marina]